MPAADTANTTSRTANAPLSDHTAAEGIRILHDMMAAVRVSHPDNSDEHDNCTLTQVGSKVSEKDNKILSYTHDCAGNRCPGRAVKKLVRKMCPPDEGAGELPPLSPTTTNATSETDTTLTDGLVDKVKSLSISRDMGDLEKQSVELDEDVSHQYKRPPFGRQIRALVPYNKFCPGPLDRKSDDHDSFRQEDARKWKNKPRLRDLVATIIQTCAYKYGLLRARGEAVVLAVTSTLSSTGVTGDLSPNGDEVKIKVEPDAPVSVKVEPDSSVSASIFTPSAAPAPAPAPAAAPVPIMPPAGPSQWPVVSVAAGSLSKQHFPAPKPEAPVSDLMSGFLPTADSLSGKADRHAEDDVDAEPELDLPSLDQIADLPMGEAASDDELDIEELAKFFDEQPETATPSYLDFGEERPSTSSSPQEVPTTTKASAGEEWAPLHFEATESATATNRYMTPFGQQVLMHHGFQGSLDSVEALSVFNSLMRSGVPLFGPSVSLSSATAVTADELSAPLVGVAAGKPGPIHVPALAAATTSVATSPAALVLHERPPSPPLDPVDDREGDDGGFGLAGPSTSTLTAHRGGPAVPASGDPLVHRFMAIGGIERVFPGLATDWSFVGNKPKSSWAQSDQYLDSVQGINYIPTGPNDPMSIARLTNPNPPSESAASSSSTAGSSSAGSTPTSLSSGSNGYSSSGSNGYITNGSGISSINSLLLGAAPFARYPSDLDQYRRSSTRSRSGEAEDDDEEDDNDSSSSNTDHGLNYTISSSLARGPAPLLHRRIVNNAAVPPNPNYNTHPSLQTRHEPAQQHRAGGPQRTRLRKQQCHECNGWYSNLAAHCATHLSYASRPHSCTICGRGFSRPNDLLRHQKSHQGDAPFCCPFHAADPRCHPSGGFSRCDTYKNHLKAMHFDYPVGTKKKERQGAGGKCKACLMEFENADEWVSAHVESGQCNGLQ
ncbi:hypothetical protein POJ06DRAFT_253501 [Lipomyces tetrasporus]|uniref:C2H2-type domain-containing protein n=1 Tax=Lipomyces tetrasporus TaxID=54092 RepID=A0AAD7QSW9_9ASCO|nr:uncharacterized protein POJ06DRAFT_253501 [Lipomyces tetrasporus]KAJ8100713.1 hypothetical protein POJ06DRAFT_253501 [Lipomyces tetrasporus]